MRYLLHPRLITCLVTALCLPLLGDQGPKSLSASMAFPDRMPRTVLWAWEEPEDLRASDSTDLGVAYLAETLLLDSHMTILPRHQPLVLPPDMVVMAVVRIQTGPAFKDTSELRQQTAEALAQISHRPGLRAFQVDFDATRSQRDFYTAVLNTLRPKMPRAMPLSITALASWCAAPDSFLSALPIDEAVPMFFRLGGHAHPGDDKTRMPIRQPICSGSFGLSTDETWPTLNPAGRLYLFAPHPWRAAQLALAASHPAALRSAPAQQGINDTGFRLPIPGQRSDEIPQQHPDEPLP